MLRVSVGTSEGVLERMRAVTLEFRNANPEAPLLRLDAEEATEERLRELAGSISLLGVPSLVIIRGPIEASIEPDALAALAPLLALSPNVFHVADEALSAKGRKLLAQGGAVMEETEGGAAAPERRFTAFPFADAVLGRDRAKAWALFLDCTRQGLAAEEIHGALVWQVKNVLLIMRETANPGLAPFVYSKGKRYAALWKPDELEAFLAELVVLYHEAHRGTFEFEAAFEKLLLERV